MRISKWTVARTVMIVLVVINLLLKASGINLFNVNGSMAIDIIVTLIEIGNIICSWWYNNSFSEEAKRADAFLKTLKQTSEKRADSTKKDK